MSSTKILNDKQDRKNVNLVKAHYKLWLSLISVNFFSYFVIRLTFLIWNWPGLHDLSAFDLLLAFLQGARFDLVISSLVALLGYLIISLGRGSLFALFLLIIICACHGLLLVANFVDSELIHFVGRRLTKNSLYLIGEGNLLDIAKYIPMTIVTGFTLFLNFYFYKKIAVWWKSIALEVFNFKNIKDFVVLFILPVLILTLIFSRGGFQEKPISFVDAKIHSNPMAHHLVLNSTFTLIKSFSQKGLLRNKDFDREEMLKMLNGAENLNSKWTGKFENKNLLFIILESFSSEYINEKNTPFLLSLSKQGAFYPKAYANGRRSIEGIASILAGVPALMDEPFINSEFSTNEFVGLGQLFQKKNYRTQFYHGAQNGSMRFDLFTKSAGFKEYYGLNEYPHKSDHDGSWGIWDEPFLKWTCDTLPEKEHFASVIFTLSSHHPYHIPTTFKDPYMEQQKNEHPILKSIRYTDYSLENFFECSKNKSWFKNTVFVFVADHTGPNLNEKVSFKELYQVPLLIYDPTQKLDFPENQLAQHIDILPTLDQLFNLNLKSKNYLAQSLLSGVPKNILLYFDQHYELIQPEAPLPMDPRTSQFNQDQFIKAFRQYFAEGLYDNRLYYPN